jgi:CDP-paratose 2-epimerase
MSVAVVTGSGGLGGSETVRFLADRGLDVTDFDNDMRALLFGHGASTGEARQALERMERRYSHAEADVRGDVAIEKVFSRHGAKIVQLLHAATQPPHDWAADDPRTDFSVNASATVGLLEAVRKWRRPPRTSGRAVSSSWR